MPDQNEIVKYSVRDFAIPSPLKGSIDSNSGLGGAPSIGNEIHQIIQQRRKEQFIDYESEVTLSHKIELEDFDLEIKGRADGLYTDNQLPVLEEIKTSFNVDDLARKLKKDPEHPYCLQLLTYGYLYYQTYGEVPELNLLAVSSKTRKEITIELSLDIEAFEKYIENRLKDILQDIENERIRAERRQSFSEQLKFPFTMPRTGQLDLINYITENVKKASQFMLQAPTGLGKTLGVFYPMLKDSLSRGQQCVYVTPKNSQHLVAEEAIKLFDLPLNSVTIFAKSKMCMKNEPICNPKFCEYAKDYYTKLYDNKILEKMANIPFLSQDDFIDLANEYEVCPFELSLDATYNADSIICDYNYVFSPNSTLKRLEDASKATENKPNLIVDEAHNLYSRALDYFSPVFSEGYLEQLREKMETLITPYDDESIGLVDEAIHLIKSFRPENLSGEAEIKITKTTFNRIDDKASELFFRYLQDQNEIGVSDPVIEFSRYTNQFCQGLAKLGDNNFITYRELKNGDSIKITCCDASHQLEGKLENFHSVVAFSATLKPFEFYRNLSGFSKDSFFKEFASPFDPAKRKLMIIPQVSTKYRDRDKNYQKITDAISRIVKAKRGNYFVFFPSFTFLKKIESMIHIDGYSITAQKPEFTIRDVTRVLNKLKGTAKNNLILGVQGGVFSEGVDYPGDMLVGAIIVGPALPNFNLERELMRGFYEDHYSDGFGYAYSYPAMSKVIQSAGRVIRTEEDRGLIVLMDQRFIQDTYSSIMPEDWFRESPQELVSNSILNDIEKFWQNDT